jgi:hypothetical protein
MNNFPSSFFDKWIKTALINLLLVAAVGVVLRYKIAFSLPIVDQRKLLHGHSHFAFAGWLSQVLMLLIIKLISEDNSYLNIRLYRKLLWGNALTAYGMLLTFPFQGYGLYSIIFSTLSVFVGYVFIIAAWKDLSKLHNRHVTSWLKAGLFFYGLSSLGAFSLAYLMANNVNGPGYYFGAVYFFLHFQYNGWFLFACFGLLFHQLDKNNFAAAGYYSKRLFRIIFFTCIPAYLLSILWMNLPSVIRVVAGITAAMQLASLIYLLPFFAEVRTILKTKFCTVCKNLWFMAMIAFVIKLLLQSLSVIPSLSAYAFGFRPVVIGYLHLCFLVILSFFILGCIYQYYHSEQKNISPAGAYLFIGGVVITEFTLMLQGFFAIESTALRYADLILFTAAALMLTGITAMVRSCYKTVYIKI